MYHHSFGLTKDPFGMTPDPAFLFLSMAHREALAGLKYAVLNRKGFVVLTGEAGTGKTTLLKWTLQSIPDSQIRCSAIFNSTLMPSEFLELALINFGMRNIPASKAARLTLLNDFLIDAHQRRQVTMLVVDEAHKLPLDVLEEIRLLSNFEASETQLLQIILAGQTELTEVLNRADMRQLKQRITVRLVIDPLSAVGVQQYIAHRWEKAGGTQAHPFAQEALFKIVEFSRGIPRLVNALCDNALLLAHAGDSRIVKATHVVEAAGDLDLLGSLRRPVGLYPDGQRSLVVRPILAKPAPPVQAGAGRNGDPAIVTNRDSKGTLNPGPERAFDFKTFDNYQATVTRPWGLTRLAARLGFPVAGSKPQGKLLSPCQEGRRHGFTPRFPSGSSFR